MLPAREEAVEFAKISKRENRVYVGNLSYDVKYRDLMEFMRGGGLGDYLHQILVSWIFRCSLSSSDTAFQYGDEGMAWCGDLLLWKRC